MDDGRDVVGDPHKLRPRGISPTARLFYFDPDSTVIKLTALGVFAA